MTLEDDCKGWDDVREAPRKLNGWGSVTGGLHDQLPYLEFLIFGFLKQAEGLLVGCLKLSPPGLVLLDGLLELVLQLLPLLVREPPELPQVLPVVAGTLLQGLLHL